MTRSGVSEVTLPAVPSATPASENGAALPILTPPRATGGDNLTKTSLPLLGDLLPLNPETDKEGITSEVEDSETRLLTPWFLKRGYSVTSAAVTVLIIIVLFPSVCLKIGV